MPRCLVSLTALGLLVGCVAAPRPHPEYLDTTDSSNRSEPARAAIQAAAPAALDLADSIASSTSHATDPLWRTDASFASEPFARAGSDSKRNQSGDYLMLKGGPLYPEESDFDTGYIVNAAFGHYVNPIVALEFEGGYSAPDAKASSVDLYSIPLLVNARVCAPIWLVEIYGGGGLGTMYYDLNTGVVDATGWLLTGDMFIGADIELFDKMTAGLELKYYITDRLRNTSDNLNSLALMVTLGWKF